MRGIAILGLAMLIGGCDASRQEAIATAPIQMAPTDPALIATVKAEREASTKVLLSCLAGAVKRLDDHKSDASTIAQAMLSACGAEFDKNVKVHSRGLDLDGEQKVSRSAREASTGVAIQMVLKNRIASQSR